MGVDHKLYNIFFAVHRRTFTIFVEFFLTELCPIQLELITKPIKVTERSRLECQSDSEELRIGF